VYHINPLPDFVLKIVHAGGLVRFLREHDIEELMA
jgi:3-isopropylmalate/(R)-2-methylmalate dehydratase small subunit